MSWPQWAVFDLDGTLCDISHRLHHIQQTPKDWAGFYAACPNDTPNDRIVALAQAWCGADSRHRLLVLSGRSDEVRVETEGWLYRCHVPFHTLMMRKEGDHRPDTIVKPEMLLAHAYTPEHVAFIVEDRASVVQAWRTLGYTCLQCAPGDF